jgi:hypothetical protein
MCRTNNALRPGGVVVLFLVVCLLSLVAHLAGDCLGVGNHALFDLKGMQGHAHMDDPCEDACLHRRTVGLSMELPSIRLQQLQADAAFSFPLSPLLPPPNS